MDNTLLKLKVNWERLLHEINSKYFNNKYSHLTTTQFFVEYFHILLMRVPKKQREEIIRMRLKEELSGVSKVICFPYKNVLKKLSKKYKLGIVSGNFRKTIKEAIKKCKIDSYIDEIIGIDDTPISKPSPVPLLMMLKKFKCKPINAVYVGDHPNDVKTGIAAGTKTIFVKNSKHYQELKRSNIKPDAIINTLFELEDVLKNIE